MVDTRRDPSNLSRRLHATSARAGLFSPPLLDVRCDRKRPQLQPLARVQHDFVHLPIGVKEEHRPAWVARVRWGAVGGTVRVPWAARGGWVAVAGTGLP